MAVIDIVSEVTGTIWKIEAHAGQHLSQDDVMLVIESMKMEIPVCAPEEGTVLEMLLNESDAVKEGALVARLETGDT